jgi:hypothetical protein
MRETFREARRAAAAAQRQADLQRAEVAEDTTRRVEPSPDLPPLPQEPAARRRALKVRGW